MSAQDPNGSQNFDRRIYWAVGAAAVFWMLLLYWFTETFNIPVGG